MNKGKKSQGINRILNNENRSIQQHQNRLASDDKHVFKVDCHDFPSLSEVFEANKRLEKKSLKCDISDSTYSAKLKVQSQDKISQNIPLENPYQNKPKSYRTPVRKQSSSFKNDSICIKSKASINNGTNNNVGAVKSSQTIQSASLESDRQQPLPVDNKLSSSNKNLSHDLHNSSTSEEKTVKSELVSHKSDLFLQKNYSDYKYNPNISLNENNSLTQKCVSMQRRSRIAHREPSTSLKKEEPFNKNHKDNLVLRSSIQNPIVSNGSDTNNWKSNLNYASPVKNGIPCNKSNEWIIIEKKSKHSEGNSASISNKSIRQSHQNIAQPSTSRSNVNIINTQKSPLNSKLSSSSENKAKSQTLNTQQASGVAVKVKKKKKRESRLKRQAALQSGKILVLTPEVHSKIIQQSNNVTIQKHKNIIVNINDSEEYPELGSSESKINKDISVKFPGKSTNTEIPTTLAIDEFKINKCEVGSPISKDVSGTNNVLEASKLDAKTTVKNPEEVKVVHSNNPITLSLFDMLLTAKPKKKESEKKDKSQEGITSPVKVIKKETIRKVVNNAVVNSLGSRPTVKRGKEREKPKMKRPSRMRKLILLGRQQNRGNMITKSHESESNDSLSDECSLLPEKYVEFDENISEVNSLNFISKDEIVSTDLNNCKTDLFSCLEEGNEKFIQNLTACDEVNQTNLQTGPTKLEINALEIFAKPATMLEGYENSDIANKSLKSNLCLINSQEVEECDILSTVPKSYDESEYKSSEEFVLHHSFPDVPFVVRENTNQLSECNFNNNLIDFENHINNVQSGNDIDCVEYEGDRCSDDIQSKKGSLSNFMKTFTDNNALQEKQDTSLNNLVETPNTTSETITEKKSSNITFSADCNSLIENKIGTISVTENAHTSEDKMTNNNKSSENIFTVDFNLSERKKTEDQSDAVKVDKIMTHSPEENSSHVPEILYSDQERLQATKFLLHSRKFRPYCNHFISKEIDEMVFALIDDLARFQDRMHQKNPVKAKIRRRLVYGIKEIKKHMQLKKIKCIIIATDIEDIKIEGGLNDIIEELKSLAETYHIPYVFSHRRFNLGKICRKSVPVSCVGIFNYGGSEKNFQKLIELYEDSKYDYSALTTNLTSELTDNQIKELFEAERESLLVLREVSQRILREMFYSSPEEFRISELSTSLKNFKSSSINADLMPYAQFDNNLAAVETAMSFPSKTCGNPEKNYALLNKSNTNIILSKYKVVKE